MGILEGTGLLVSIGAVVLALVVGLIVFMVIARTWIKVASADEALIISGKRQKDADGTEHETTVIVQGRAMVKPIGQSCEKISLRSRQVPMQVSAQSSDNVTLDVDAVALVKIGSDPKLVREASERFASNDKDIERFTQDQLEGVLRGVVAQQTVVSLMRERKELSLDIADSVVPELLKQGLILDSFQIRGITDDLGYIQSLGAPEIESKRQQAEISQSRAERAIAQEQISNEEKNLVEQTALDTNSANATSEVGRARAEAEQAEALAGERARQEVLQQQAENRQAQLDADVKRVADAERYRRQQEAEANAFEQRRGAEARAEVAEADARAVELRAKADAESVRLAGEAKADAIKAEAEALRENQDAVLAREAMSQLPQLMESFARGYANIGEITVIGGGGEGSESLAGNQFAGESAVALRGVFSSVEAATGLDLAAIIQGRATGAATGEAIGASLNQTEKPIILDEKDSLLGEA